MLKISINDSWFCYVLGLIFIVLKLCNIIGWSWWFILMPIYGVTAIGLLIVLIGLILALIGLFI